MKGYRFHVRLLPVRRSFARLLTVVVVVLTFSACSGSFEFSTSQSATDAALDLIEGDAMMQRLNVEPISDAECIEPEAEDVGVIFECTALSGGNKINFEVEIEPEERIFAAPTNIVAAQWLETYTTSAVENLNAQNGFSLPLDSLDCGDKSVVLDAENKMYCVLDDPSTNTLYNVEFTVRDIEQGTYGVEIVSEVE